MIYNYTHGLGSSFTPAWLLALRYVLGIRMLALRTRPCAGLSYHRVASSGWPPRRSSGRASNILRWRPCQRSATPCHAGKYSKSWSQWLHVGPRVSLLVCVAVYASTRYYWAGAWGRRVWCSGWGLVLGLDAPPKKNYVTTWSCRKSLTPTCALKRIVPG